MLRGVVMVVVVVVTVVATTTVARASELVAGKARITEIAVEVEPTTARGKPWDTAKDAIGAPDLVIKLRANGKKLVECEASLDSVRGFCQLDEEIELTADTRIELEVVDDDGVFDDKIGGGALAHLIGDDGGKHGFDVTGQVKSATLGIEPVPSWLAAHRPGLLGFAFGIAGALGLVGVFRKRLLAPDPPPPAMPRCAHCSAELRKRDRRCFNCGAPR